MRVTFANPRFEHKDMAVDFAEIAHVGVRTTSFAVIALPAGCTHSRTKEMLDFGQLTVCVQVEPPFVIRTEEFALATASWLGSFTEVQLSVILFEEDDVSPCFRITEFVRVAVPIIFFHNCKAFLFSIAATLQFGGKAMQRYRFYDGVDECG